MTAAALTALTGDAAAAERPRVLLVDDDATLRRLVAMMLEELPITLLSCGSAEEARALLQAQPVELLITDWMMPGESGRDLLLWLQARPQLRAQARLVVFSAGLDEGVRSQLQGLDVWRALDKPVSLQAMEQCVRDALQLPDPTAPGSGPGLAPVAAEDGEAAAIRLHFAGNAELFHAFKADCLQQMSADIAAGDAALSSGDSAALRRLAHNLKGALRSLGREALAQRALELELAAAAGLWPQMRQLWPVLRQACRDWAYGGLAQRG